MYRPRDGTAAGTSERRKKDIVRLLWTVRILNSGKWIEKNFKRCKGVEWKAQRPNSTCRRSALERDTSLVIILSHSPHQFWNPSKKKNQFWSHAPLRPIVVVSYVLTWKSPGSLFVILGFSRLVLENFFIFNTFFLLKLQINILYCRNFKTRSCSSARWTKSKFRLRGRLNLYGLKIFRCILSEQWTKQIFFWPMDEILVISLYRWTKSIFV